MLLVVSRRRPALAVLTTLLVACLILAACSSGEGAPATAAPRADRFDARRAFRDLRAQVALGPRPAGSPASRRLAVWLRDRLPGGRFEAVPGGLRDVVGRLPGRGRAILVGAHYDTKDIPRFVGANDGAGGVAVVLELARVLRAGRRACDREIRFVMFDGEESPRDSTDFLADGLRGSRAYAAAHARALRAAVVVDFVADKNLSIPREAGSDRALWARLRRAAARAGSLDAFPPASVGEILDDHTPFARAGVPAIDLIDFDYPYFHRPSDTIDKVSARSLGRVGQPLVGMLRGLARETCQRR